ncbi:MAG: helix-turn-helix transcriptional regulator [Ferrovibrionaceae bacterium]
MNAYARQYYRVGGLVVEERPIGQGSPDLLPQSIGGDIERRTTGYAGINGEAKRLAIRPGFDLTLYDMHVEDGMLGGGDSDACLSLSVVLNGDGEGELEEGGGIIRYRPGQSYLCHSTRRIVGIYNLPAGTHFRLVELRFSLDFIARIGANDLFLQAGDDHPLHCVSRPGVWIGQVASPPAVAAAAEAIMAIGLDGPGDDLAIEARALDILTAMIALMRSPAVRRSNTAGRDSRRLAEARAMMLGDLARNWTIRDIARAVGLNEKKLKAGFRDAYGLPVHAFLQRARLDAARDLLETSDTTVTEASMTVGYANPSHFARLFRREFGQTPSAFAGGRP